jgi:hypothetical protein
VELCGLATLASAFVILNFYEPKAEQVAFNTACVSDYCQIADYRSHSNSARKTLWRIKPPDEEVLFATSEIYQSSN